MVRISKNKSKEMGARKCRREQVRKRGRGREGGGDGGNWRIDAEIM